MPNDEKFSVFKIGKSKSITVVADVPHYCYLDNKECGSPLQFNICVDSDAGYADNIDLSVYCS